MSQSGPAYVAGDVDSPVAICTLSSHDLLRSLAESDVAGRVAILGPLETENLGLERMLTTLLERPRIRWLVVCGDERRGPYQAQALRALFENGVDDDGTVRGARSRRARLATLAPAHVEIARRQVQLRDLVGSHDLMRIAEAVEACRAADPGPFRERVELPKPEPIVVPTRPFQLRDPDPNGFFVVLVDRPGARLLAEHYANSGELLHRIAGADAASLCGALVAWGLVTRLEHAAYLGRELTKAELALRQGWSYLQDEPLGLPPGLNETGATSAL
ncbi:MAG: tetrahydromethanopterin S-methyltransferase subunit [Chloroflexota bacterium]|nr:tetrahydromethanopterin S-methyltransferase subunit [Chloroflexota bacterium]